MVDETPGGIAPNPIHPEPFAAPLGPTPSGFGSTPPYSPPPTTRPPFGNVEPKVDHLAEIAELAKSLHNVSPSGAQTVSGQILEHVNALQAAKA